MLHGMTGTREKMRPFAEKLLPEGWFLHCPEGMHRHPRGGLAWWIEGENDEILKQKIREEQIQLALENLERGLPDGRLILGGFSQGGAIASAMVGREIFNRVSGLILISTKNVMKSALETAVSKTEPRPVIWMHGERDHIIPIDVALDHISVFEKAGWEVNKMRHQKGHMVDLQQLDSLVKAVTAMAV